MLLREVEPRRPHALLAALAIGVFSCLAAASLAIAFLSLATGCYHARPRYVPEPSGYPAHATFTACSLVTDEHCGCSFSYVRPAYLCPGYTSPQHDGCHWRCEP